MIMFLFHFHYYSGFFSYFSFTPTCYARPVFNIFVCFTASVDVTIFNKLRKSFPTFNKIRHVFQSKLFNTNFYILKIMLKIGLRYYGTLLYSSHIAASFFRLTEVWYTLSLFWDFALIGCNQWYRYYIYTKINSFAKILHPKINSFAKILHPKINSFAITQLKRVAAPITENNYLSHDILYILQSIIFAFNIWAYNEY